MNLIDFSSSSRHEKRQNILACGNLNQNNSQNTAGLPNTTSGLNTKKCIFDWSIGTLGLIHFICGRYSEFGIKIWE